MSSFANVLVRYDEPVVEQTDTTLNLRVPTDALRANAGLTATFRRPGVVRDAFASLYAILNSDLRRKAPDRADYLAYLQKQGKKASKELWEAQKKYIAEEYGETEASESVLDPIVSVSESELAIEVFSADQSAYARLAFKSGEAYDASNVTVGTSHMEFASDTAAAFAKMRSYRNTTISLSPSSGGVERSLKVPYQWVRALSQVQSASTLPSVGFELAPVDLYNVLLTLRMNRAKKSPRALRYELIPGERPRIVLEPWDTVIECTGETFEGLTPQVVRTWGRRRLGALAAVLPHAKSVSVRLVGPGLPAYYVIDLGDATLTYALSGWTASGWAGIASFDLLTGEAVDEVLVRAVQKAVAEKPQSIEELAATLGRDKSLVRNAVLTLLQEGVAVIDAGTQKVISRALFEKPLAVDKLRYRDGTEAHAHALLSVPGQVQITRIHDLGGEGVRIEGEVEDRAAHRTYKSSFTIDREGRTVDASCTSPQFRKAGLREGPTAPMIALRLSYGRQRAELERLRETPEGRASLHAETRTMIKREDGSTTIYRISLDQRTVTLRWGNATQFADKQHRLNRFFFTKSEEARDEYFRRLDACASKGFIDASAAEAI